MTTIKNNHSLFETVLLDDKCSDSKCILYENLIDEKMSANLFINISTTLPFEWTHYTIDGKSIRSPRRMVWMTSLDKPYKFSSNHDNGLPPHDFTKEVLEIKNKVDNLLHTKFNAVLINLYMTGDEYSDWHSDDDPWMGSCPTIASVTLGAKRNFCIRSKHDNSYNQTIVLPPGSLLVMSGNMQENYQHSLPIDEFDRHSTNPRINLTFRYIDEELIHVENSKPYWNS